MKMIDLEKRVSLVTGASGGIGSVIAKTLAGAGSRVALGYRTNEEGAKTALAECGADSILVRADLSDADQCAAAVRRVIQEFGRIDILVNNAAIDPPDSFNMPFEEWTGHWQKVMNANLMSTVNMTYHCVAPMRAGGGGKIINISSRSALRGETEFLAYAVSKAAMVNFTRCIAQVLAGTIFTPMRWLPVTSAPAWR